LQFCLKETTVAEFMLLPTTFIDGRQVQRSATSKSRTYSGKKNFTVEKI
jgi:hypothetical protein